MLNSMEPGCGRLCKAFLALIFLYLSVFGWFCTTPVSAMSKENAFTSSPASSTAEASNVGVGLAQVDVVPVARRPLRTSRKFLLAVSAITATAVLAKLFFNVIHNKTVSAQTLNHGILSP